MDFPASHVPVKCSGPVSTYTLAAHRQSHSVAVMMPGLRTIPDTNYTNYMTVFNLFYAYYTEKNLACGAPYRTFNTYDTNKMAAPFHHPVLKCIIPSQI